MQAEILLTLKLQQRLFADPRRIALLKQIRPEIVVGVCGCMAQLRADEIHRRALAPVFLQCILFA